MSAELDDALRPLASLLSKSDKAQQKLKPGTWQHSMLEDNIQALRLALSLLFAKRRKSQRFSESELKMSTKSLAAMIRRSIDAQAKFQPGTSPHTLQRNRIKALRLAKKLTTAELKRLPA